jgi:carbon-monoxide dehydrogenase medium subunit
MLPARFDYAAPTSVEEAISLLAEGGEDAKVLAGGQSLLPLMKLRLARPALIVDLNRVPGLDEVREDGDVLRIGPLVRTATLERDDAVPAGYGLIGATAPLISDPIIRNLGTMAGSLAHADPAGDWGSATIAMRGEVVARGTGGERTIPVRELFRGTFETVLEPGELITEVRIPRPAARSGGAYNKLERKVGDYATVATAVQLELDDGHVAQAGIALTSVGSINIAAVGAEDALRGAEPTDAALDEAARLAAQAADPSTDVRGSADYKREVVRVFVRRGLARALEIARGR